jgi:hypothetical protein
MVEKSNLLAKILDPMTTMMIRVVILVDGCF